jgi:peroxiredoxin
MNRFNTLASIATVLFFAALFTSAFLPKKEQTIRDFTLRNVDGKSVSLSDYPNAKGFVIVFTCNHCPFAKLYPERLNALSAKYAPLGIPLIAVSSTDTMQYEDDGFLQMVEKAKVEQFTFPYLYDSEQAVAKQFDAQKTPHAYIVWKQDGQFVVKYNGAIDDNGMAPEKVEHSFVANALDELLAGKSVSEKETKSIGCQIYFRK